MAVRLSTGYASAILGPTSIDTLFQDGCVQIYSGVQPASADDAPTGSLLARITRDGGPWVAGSSTNGLRVLRLGRAAVKDESHVWRMKGLAVGTAGWMRWLPNAADPETYSTTAVRIDGAIGVLGVTGDYQMFLPTLAITLTTDVVFDDWWFAIPPLGV